MTSIRQSITALYEEAEKNADEGAPLFAVMQGSEITEPALEAVSTLASLPQNFHDLPISERFEELRSLAESEVQTTLIGIMPLDQKVATPPAVHETISTSINLTENSDKAEANNDKTEASDDKAEAVSSNPDTVSTFTVSTLPEEPPAPAAGSDADDLNMSDIHELVRAAWDDEQAVGSSAQEQDTAPGPSTIEEQPSSAADNDMETAMEEIAAAVGKMDQPDPQSPVDVDALKSEIVTAAKSELRLILEQDLGGMVRSIVTEVMAEAEKKTERKTRSKSPKVSAGKTAQKARSVTKKKKMGPEDPRDV